ncbi:hypothetical protein [Paucibacter sp. XJ19-41]|uniref:hypothetical protein n=1 Tax=Paucibacter sp. XJ19-41 TaxID=2927824 RepID=UPI00234BA4C0|nr:hypothetical protein [Paucibacter sp. XJ19-41]MDC6167817.1 hypothetical protein [Paucibacter sp. XJ19-41]
MHHNKLLAKLGRADRQNLLRCGEIVQLEAGAVLHKAGLPSANAYFPIAGAFALVGGLAEGPQAGLALVGRESMLGIHLVLGDRIAPVESPRLPRRPVGLSQTVAA